MKTTWFLMDVGESDAFAVFDALPNGCILVDNGEVIAANSSFVDLVGASTKLAVIGQKLEKYLVSSNSLSNSKLEAAAKTKQSLFLDVQGSSEKTSVVAKVSKQEDASKTKCGYLLSLSDVSPQHQLDASLPLTDTHHNMLFSYVMNLTDSYYIYYNLDCEVVDFSATANTFHEELLGVEIQRGTHYTKLAYEDAVNTTTNNYLKETLKKGSVKRQTNINGLDGKKRYFDIDYQLTKDAKGHPIGIVEYCREVTSNVNLAIENQNTQFTFQGLIDNSTDVLTILDTDLNFVFFNDVFLNNLKYFFDLSPQVGQNYLDVFEGMDDFEKLLEQHKAVINTGKEFRHTFNLKKGGKVYFLKNHLSPLRNKKNEIVALVSRTIDVTEEIARTKELEKSNATLKAIMDSSLSGICALDPDYNVVVYNKTAYGEFLKYGGVDLSIPGSIKNQLSPEEFERWDKELFSRVFKGESFSSIVRRKEDGRVHRNSYTPVINNKNEIVASLEMSQDITDYVKSKTELQESKDRMKTILDRNPAGIARLDLEGRIKYVSPKGAAFFGKKAKEVEGKLAKEIVDESMVSSFTKAARNLLNGDDSVFVDLEFDQNKEKEKIFAQGIATLIRKDNGDPQEFFISFLDITEKVNNKSLLAKSQDTYEMLFSNMLDAVVVWDKATGHIELANKAAEKLLGRSEAELKQSFFSSFVPEKSSFLDGVEIRNEYKLFKERIRNGEYVEHKTFVVTREDESERLVEVRVLNLKEGMDYVYMTLVDRTDIYQAEKELTRSSSIFESLIHNSFDGIDVIRYTVEDDFFVSPKLIVRNDKMVDMLGVGSKDQVFDTVAQFMTISPERQLDGELSEDRLKDAIVTTIKTGQHQTEYRLEHDCGKLIDIVASQKLVHLDNDVFFIKNFRDISKEVESRSIIQSQIEEARERNCELEKYIESNLQLENFAYIASHDLKAPIRSVISFAQLLKNNVYKDLDAKNQRFLDIMISASTNMQVLIDDLLAYSRINTQAIEFENVDVKQLLDYLLVEIGSTIAEKNGEVVIDKMPNSIVADTTRLRQVFQNLITNAMKFHKEGETPKVEVSCQDYPSRYEFSVRDYGIGVEEQYLSEIFLMFKKLHSENKFKGTGIGLSICKKIAEQHGGTIRAESVIGEGTTIIFSISKSLEVNI